MRTLLLLAVALIFAGHAHAQTLTFTSKLTRSVESMTPELTWSTAPAGATCVASGDAAWTGSKPAAGAVTLAVITTSKNYSLSCTWPGDTQATLNWIAPTTYTHGGPLVVASYSAVYGLNATEVLSAIPPAATTDEKTFPAPAVTNVITGLNVPGTYFFCLRALDAAGTPSECGKTQAGAQPSKVITGSSVQTRAVSVTVDPKPAAPAGLSVS